jgi:hypothetical protein
MFRLGGQRGVRLLRHWWMILRKGIAWNLMPSSPGTKTSKTPVVDLSRVAEEPDESGSSRGEQSGKDNDKEKAGGGRGKLPALRLGKGKGK